MLLSFVLLMVRIMLPMKIINEVSDTKGRKSETQNLRRRGYMMLMIPPGSGIEAGPVRWGLIPLSGWSAFFCVLGTMSVSIPGTANQHVQAGLTHGKWCASTVEMPTLANT